MTVHNLAHAERRQHLQEELKRLDAAEIQRLKALCEQTADAAREVAANAGHAATMREAASRLVAVLQTYVIK